jgi:poly(3-hydroxybutyrate) depolymerase
MPSFPRDLSQRAARAARVFARNGDREYLRFKRKYSLSPFLLLLAACAGDRAAPLPRFDLDPDRIAVAGLSSGAYMATQAHFAFSDHLRGALLVAGGPYGCAGGSIDTALGPCIAAKPTAPDPARLAAVVRDRAGTGALAPLTGLQGDRVYVLHGARDPLVSPRLADASAALYADLGGGDVALQLDRTRAFGHVLPTLATGVDCVAGGSPYLGRCDFDAAGSALEWIYGTPPAPAPAVAGGELRHFDQSALAAEGAANQLAASGLLYVPTACAAGARCGLLVVFHGCEQSAGQVGETFARDAGFNRWADVHALVVLYPQVEASWLPLNPKACWDWWGYTGADYDTRGGAQLRWLAAASAALGAPLE